MLYSSPQLSICTCHGKHATSCLQKKSHQNGQEPQFCYRRIETHQCMCSWQAYANDLRHGTLKDAENSSRTLAMAFSALQSQVVQFQLREYPDGFVQASSATLECAHGFADMLIP